MSRPLFEGSRRQQPRPQVSLLSCAGNHDPRADQKDRGVWEQDCVGSYLQVTWWSLGHWKGRKEKASND